MRIHAFLIGIKEMESKHLADIGVVKFCCVNDRIRIGEIVTASKLFLNSR